VPPSVSLPNGKWACGNYGWVPVGGKCAAKCDGAGERLRPSTAAECRLVLGMRELRSKLLYQHNFVLCHVQVKQRSHAPQMGGTQPTLASACLAPKGPKVSFGVHIPFQRYFEGTVNVVAGDRVI